MKKKGFTLTELLAVIVVLAILTMLAVGGFGTLSKKLKEKSYENVVSYIETKAASYAEETGNLITNVDNLVKLGYIEADDEKGNVIDPRNGEYLNCHIVNIVKEENNLYGRYSSEEEECKLENLVMNNLNLGINVYTTINNVTKNEQVEANTWVKENVILEVYLKENLKPEEVTSIIWQSNVSREERKVTGNFNNKNQYLITAEQILNTAYTVTVVLNDTVSYQTQVVVKIDKQSPIVYTKEVYIEKENEYTNNDKKITVSASDGNGSGIYGYFMGETPDCSNVEYEEYESNTYEINKDNGTYYVCVKDKVGNVTAEKIVIDKVDKTAPTCTITATGTMGKNDWYISDTLTFTLNPNDEGGSGIRTQILSSESLTENTDSFTVTGLVTDHAGNGGECSLTIKKDNTKPTLTAKNPKNYLAREEANEISNYYNSSFGISGGSISCKIGNREVTNVNSLAFGLNTVSCTAIGNNGLATPLNLIFSHQYEGNGHCGNGGSLVNNRTCHYNSNASVCGETCHYGCDSCYNSCKTGNPSTCVPGNVEDKSNCLSYNWNQTYSPPVISGYNCGACHGSTATCFRQGGSMSQEFACIPGQATRGSCKQYGSKYEPCAYTTNTCQGGYDSCNCSDCKTKTANSCDSTAYLSYSCPTTGTNGNTGATIQANPSGSTCRF